MTPARRRTRKVATPPGNQKEDQGPPAGDPWALLQACQAISAELALPPLLLRLASALTEASGATRVCLLLPADGKLLVQAEAVRGPDGQVRARALEPVAAVEHPWVSAALVEVVAQRQQAQWLDEVGPPPRAIWCVPISRPASRPAELQALVHLESDRPDTMHPKPADRLGGPGLGPAEAQAVGHLLAQAAISLENARQHGETQAALRVREDFLSEAAHELYTPLSSLKLVLDTLSPTVPGTPAADQAIFTQSVDIARRQGRRLERLIRELLEVSRVDTGKLRLELQEVDLGQLTREVVEHLAVEARRAGCRVSVQPDSPPVVGRWDRSRLDQVIANLLANAFKFGAGQPVEITVSRGAGPPTWWCATTASAWTPASTAPSSIASSGRPAPGTTAVSAWASTSAGPSCKPTAARSRCRAPPGPGRPSPSSCRRRLPCARRPQPTRGRPYLRRGPRAWASASPSPYASPSPSPRRWRQHILLSISTTRTKRALAWAPVLLGHDVEQTNDVEQSARLHGRAASDGAEPGAVRGLAVSASALGDIQGNRDSGTTKLVRQGSLAAGQALSNAQGIGDEFDRALIHVPASHGRASRSFVGAGDSVAWRQGRLIQINAQAPRWTNAR